jgi:SNF2 family DNA or RNA helicase
MNEKQKFLYRNFVQYFIKKIYEKESSEHRRIRFIVNKFPFLSLSLDNPEILQQDESLILPISLKQQLDNWEFKDHSKLEVCDSLVYKYIREGHKVIIWSGHPRTIESLAKHYEKYMPIIIHGQNKIGSNMTVNEWRDQQIELFKNDESKKLLIGSYKVMGMAINLTEICRNIYFDRSYDLKEWLQSIKRTHRFGQDSRVIVNPIIIEESLDERLDRMLEQKEDINSHLFDRSRMSMEEWKALFSGK